MFDPKIIGQDAFGMHENILDVANRVEEVGNRKLMLNNIVLTGGNTLFKNFRERLTDEVIKMSAYP